MASHLVGAYAACARVPHPEGHLSTGRVQAFSTVPQPQKNVHVRRLERVVSAEVIDALEPAQNTLRCAVMHSS